MSRTYLQRHGRLLTKGGDDASDHRAVLWSGRASGDGRGVPSSRRAWGAPEQGGADVPHRDAGPRSVAGLAAGGGSDACRDGEHGRLLAPGLRRPRGAFRADRRERTAHPQRAGAQDRCEGFRVDRRSGSARPDRQELRAAPAAAGAARVAALSPQAGGEPVGRTQPAPEAPGNRQHQAGERRQRRLRGVRPRDAPGDDRGRGLSRGDGRSRQGASCAASAPI